MEVGKNIPSYLLIWVGAKNVRWVALLVLCLATGWTTGRSRFNPGQRQGPFPGAKAQLVRRDAENSPPSSAKVKNEYELYLLSPQVPS
jgi:hypothetical protein